MMKHVCVLMSTYNGSQYLNSQLDSILAQEGVAVSLNVRDDHSTDDTLAILERNAAKLTYSAGENIGPARSFMSLLNASGNSDYYAFSDQDDYWERDKLVAAVSMLEPFEGEPALYLGQTRLVNKDLNPLEYTPVNPLVTFGESLIYEFAAGCTIVMNKWLKDIIIRYEPKYLKMHDVWIYSVALAIGAKVVFDPEPHILYRQHGNNAVGQGFNRCEAWRRRIRRVMSKEESRSRRAAEILKGYETFIPTKNKDILTLFIGGKSSLRKRMKLLFDSRYRVGKTKVGRMFKISLLLNQY